MSEKKTRVLVTGATGFIALHCMARLLDEGYQVRGTLRSQSRKGEVESALKAHLKGGKELELVEADLTGDSGWEQAMKGCTYVLHVASPLPRQAPKHPDELIIPARDGALRVLKAASEAGVKRVVLTSSIAAITEGHPRKDSRIFDESFWSDLSGSMGAYEQSKTIAERAAWDFMDTLSGKNPMELAVINPGLVLGPLLSPDHSTSCELIRKLMVREVPGCPDLAWPLVDVRDVADAHVSAMKAGEAPGKRFICCTEDSISMFQMAEILDRTFSEKGYRIPTKKVPGFVLYLVAIFDRTTRLVLNRLGVYRKMSNRQIISVLDWKPRSVEEMVVATGESMIGFKVV